MPDRPTVPADRELNLILDLCLRVGELLLSSGGGAADVTATMLGLADCLGVRRVDLDVDITFTSLGITHQVSPEARPLVATRTVQRRAIDYQDLTDVDHLVRDVGRGVLDLDGARVRLRRIVSTGHDRRRWAVTAGWGVMCGGIALQLGGDRLVVPLALLSAVIIDRLQQRMARRRLPSFYQQVAGGLVASLVAVAAAAVTSGIDVSQVVTANIVMLLSGVGFMGALQDALTGFYITAGARLTEALLSTAGIIAGVSGGLTLADAAGVDLPDLDPGQTGIAGFGLAALGAAVAAAAFAYASYSPRRVLAPVALMAAVAVAVSRSLEEPGIGSTWAVAVAALVVGLVGYGAAARLRVPPLVVVVSAVVPLLPGIAIYRGLSLASAGDRRDTSLGLVSVTTAASVALALAAGVILGQYLAQPLEREAVRWESRLAGPRLVGPLRLARRRRVRRGRGVGRAARTTAPTSRRTAPPAAAPPPARRRTPDGPAR